RFEVARRRPSLPHLRGNDLDEVALQAADDALMSVLARLDDFRGASRFTTWAYKFAPLEAAVKLRKRAWQGREIPLEPETWSLFSSAGPGPGASGAERAPPDARAGDRRGIDAAPAAGPRRPSAQRGADRRHGRTPEHHPGRALQDAARRPAQAAQAPDRFRSRGRGREEVS